MELVLLIKLIENNALKQVLFCSLSILTILAGNASSETNLRIQNRTLNFLHKKALPFSAGLQFRPLITIISGIASHGTLALATWHRQPAFPVYPRGNGLSQSKALLYRNTH